jgi:hypothetical protein
MNLLEQLVAKELVVESKQVELKPEWKEKRLLMVVHLLM